MRKGAILINGLTVIPNARKATWFWERMRGLLGERDLPPGYGIFLPKCSAVHTVGMRFALDLIFLDKNGRVEKTLRDVPPGRMIVTGTVKSRAVVELKSGWLALPSVGALCEFAEVRKTITC